MTTDNLADQIHNLHEHLEDSRKGYQECAEEVKDPTIKAKLTSLATRRQQMITNLQTKALSLGQKSQSTGSVTAAAHRFFINLKSLFTGGDKEAIIEEIKRGENFLISQYEDVLKAPNLPFDLAQLLQHQLQEIRTDLSQIQTFYSATIS